ncbi:MAG: mechanosensitive ion channel family protein [Lachnospiraceae bacterium]|nr:mechanosensitive ion channel family protein [Lachnospiraceae bacterium]
MDHFINDMVEIFNVTEESVGNDPLAMILVFLLLIFILVIAYLGIALFIWLLLKLNRRIFSHVRKKKGNQLQFQLLERLVSVAIVVLLIIIPFAGDNIAHSILGSTAVLAAVIGFAAQDVIKDMLSGLQISIYKPFDVGDRIELEDGRIGVVESITLRHVVLSSIDTLKIVIPNSKINSMTVKNFSYKEKPKSIVFRYPVAYDSDIEKVKTVIAKAVKESSFSKPGKPGKDKSPEYAPVYFISLADSALIMSVTVYCEQGFSSEMVMDDINSRVFEALKANGIEIPYNYTNLVIKKG